MRTNWQHFQVTGHDAIDGEHRCIAESFCALLGAINAARPPDVVAALGTVLHAFRVHFEHEEALMLQGAYPQRARHQEAHALFLADAARFYVEAQQRGLTEGVRRWCTGRALEWFRLHIAMNDVGLGRWLHARGLAGQAAVLAARAGDDRTDEPAGST